MRRAHEAATDARTVGLRQELGALPSRMRALPVDRGYPVPWFVAWVDGQPEFRAMDGRKWAVAVRERRCWVCGQPTGGYLAFVLGPMCGISRTTTEPACHRECAIWSCENCPFLTRPDMVRRDNDGLAEQLRRNVPGTMLERNPGVTAVWIARTFETFADPHGKPLLRVGNPVEVLWFARGRRASRAEVLASVDSGFPTLLQIAEEQDRREGDIGAVDALWRQRAQFEQLLPAL